VPQVSAYGMLYFTVSEIKVNSTIFVCISLYVYVYVCPSARVCVRTYVCICIHVWAQERVHVILID
jgi:hypothetical protein